MRADDLEQFTAGLLLLLQESLDYQQDQPEDPWCDVLRQAIAHVGRVYRRIVRSTGRYVVAVVGLSNVGKSTLLNALLGADLTPRSNGPCTACPVEFARGPSYRLTAHLAGDFRPRVEVISSVDSVRDRLGALVTASHPMPGRACQRVVVELDHPLLQHGLVLADTPGFGSALITQEENSHDAVIRNYLSQVAHVFWVVLGDQGIGQREREFYEQWLIELCDDVIVTGGEDWDERSRRRFLQRYSPLFAEQVRQFHFVGTSEGPAIRSIASRIEEIQSVDDRLGECRIQLRKLARGVKRWIDERREGVVRRDRRLWRPDSWARFARDDGEINLREEILSLWRTI